jgi:hypothetical protein
MQTAIDTIRDVLFEKKEQLKISLEKEEGLVNHLCSQHRESSNLKDKIDRLEADLKRMYHQSPVDHGEKLANTSSVSERPMGYGANIRQG